MIGLKCPICDGTKRMLVDYPVITEDGTIACVACDATGKITNLKLWRELKKFVHKKDKQKS